MLSVFGKIYEKLINNHWKEELRERGALSNLQSGFREGRSTGGAFMMLKKMKRGARSRKRFCVVVSFDVKNAFNSIRWGQILERLHTVGVPEYLRDIIREYGHNCTVTYVDNSGSTRSYPIDRGVPQGSVLGPTLP